MDKKLKVSEFNCGTPLYSVEYPRVLSKFREGPE